MGAIKNKTLLKSQGKKGTSESQNQIDGWAQIQWFSALGQPTANYTQTQPHSAFVLLQVVFITTGLFIFRVHSCDKKRTLNEMKGARIMAHYWLHLLADSHNVKPILRFSDFLLAFSGTRQTFCCTKLNGISHKNDPFSTIAWEVCFTVQPGVRPRRQRTQMCTENSGGLISGASGVSLMCRSTEFGLGSPAGSWDFHVRYIAFTLSFFITSFAEVSL